MQRIAEGQRGRGAEVQGCRGGGGAGEAAGAEVQVQVQVQIL